MGYLFHPKSIWMGKFWKIGYQWGQFSKIVYKWGQFSMWEVYEWVMFFTWPGIWMGWGSGTPAAHPYPKSWQVTPRVKCTEAGTMVLRFPYEYNLSITFLLIIQIVYFYYVFWSLIGLDSGKYRGPNHYILVHLKQYKFNQNVLSYA